MPHTLSRREWLELTTLNTMACVLPSDRSPDVIDTRALGTFVEAFATVAQTLAGREPFRS